MIDLDKIKKRASGGLPPTLLPHHEGETPAEATSREIHNKWLREWSQDRRDLLAALRELELLRGAIPLELGKRVARLAAARREHLALEGELAAWAESFAATFDDGKKETG